VARNNGAEFAFGGHERPAAVVPVSGTHGDGGSYKPLKGSAMKKSFEKLVFTRSSKEALYVARYGDCTPKKLHRIVKTARKDVVLAVLQRDDCPDEVFRYLAESDWRTSQQVMAMVARHLSASAETLTVVFEIPHRDFEYVHPYSESQLHICGSLANNPNTSAQLLVRLLGRALELRRHDLFNHTNVARLVAVHPNSTPEILVLLALSFSEDVQLLGILAKNPLTPDHLVVKLAGHADEGVREAVAERMVKVVEVR
jgi:hypothetical protein